jgi:hypothetical protein
LGDWVKKFADDPERAFPGHGQMKPEQLEIARLKRELTKLEAERDILKKAAAYFATKARHPVEVQHLRLTIDEQRAMISNYQLAAERRLDYQLLNAAEHIRNDTKDMEPEFNGPYEVCREFTMTSRERMYALWQAIRYIVANGIPGDIVECGVWRGGSMRLAAMTLLSLNSVGRDIWLYDTFEGHTEPTQHDIDLYGYPAKGEYDRITNAGGKWAFATLDEVRAVMAGCHYPAERIRFVQGPVQETLGNILPERIALLRLDTDWYESTKCEMERLYPLLSTGGILALDDYGHYRGARQAVDEYLSTLAQRPMLHRVDYSGRFAIKP